MVLAELLVVLAEGVLAEGGLLVVRELLCLPSIWKICGHMMRRWSGLASNIFLTTPTIFAASGPSSSLAGCMCWGGGEKERKATLDNIAVMG